MSSATVPQAVQVCHELLLWVIPQLDRFPRARRFTLGERIETGLLEVSESLVGVAGKLLMSSLRREPFLLDCKNSCEGTWCDSPNPSDQPFAIDCT